LLEEDKEESVYSYTVAVDSSLFGRLRMRCWAEGESRPSRYSNAVKLPRFISKEGSAGGKDAMQQTIEKERASYYHSMPEHVTVGKPIAHRIGNVASTNVWGGDRIPQPPPPDTKGQCRGMVMAPVPYDVPALPPGKRLQEAGARLASTYRTQPYPLVVCT